MKHKTMNRICIAALAVAAVGGCWAGEKNPRLLKVTAIYVQGNNRAAQAIRRKLRKGFKKGCLTLANKHTEADAVLQVDTQFQNTSGIPGLGGSRSVASGTLTTPGGEYLWDHSARFTNAPFRSGAKTAGVLVLHRLAKAAQCKARLKK